MRRREFIAGLGAAITGSIQTNAEQLPPVQLVASPPVSLVGFLYAGPTEGFTGRQVAFRQGLAAAGYFEGCNLAIESRWARNAFYRLPDLANELVDRGVAVLVASGSVPAILAAKAATTTIPIVFGCGADPVETGLVSSLDHPGGNITGITSLTVDIGSKRLGLLRDLLPGATRIAVLVDPNDDAIVVKSTIADVRAAAIAIGREIEVFYAGDAGEIDAAFASLVEKRSEVLLVSPSTFFSGNRMQIVALAAQQRVPALYFEREYADIGGLMSYGADNPEQYRQLGIYAGRILNGKKPGDLPVQRATRLEFVVNLKTAEALGLTIPPRLVGIADELIR
jgi:putative tryptophan/tyrosine transport system substrate-binding protein